jgi:hypothetical protein
VAEGVVDVLEVVVDVGEVVLGEVDEGTVLSVVGVVDGGVVVEGSVVDTVDGRGVEGEIVVECRLLVEGMPTSGTAGEMVEETVVDVVLPRFFFIENEMNKY